MTISMNTSLVSYPTNAPQGRQLTPLENSFLEAGEKWEGEALKDCISKGVDITAVDSHLNTVLHRFFHVFCKYEEKHVAALDVLLNHADIGKIINAKNKDGNTPLLLLMDHKPGFRKGFSRYLPKIMNRLFKAGAFPDAVNGKGDNALHLILKFFSLGWGDPFLRIISNTARNIDEMSLLSSLEHIPFSKKIKSLVGDYVGTAEKRLYALANGIFSASAPPLAQTLYMDRGSESEYVTAVARALIFSGADPTVSITQWDRFPLSSYGNYPANGTSLIEFIHSNVKGIFSQLREYSSDLKEAKEKLEKQRSERLSKHSVVDLKKLIEFFDQKPYGMVFDQIDLENIFHYGI